jgi:hypothetical protein
MAKFNHSRRFGVEMEVHTRLSDTNLARAITIGFERDGINQTCNAEGYHHTTRNHWKIVSDSSLTVRGWEIVSPPLKGYNGRKEIESVCKTLNALRTAGQPTVTVSKQTGLHVHHDAADKRRPDRVLVARDSRRPLWYIRDASRNLLWIASTKSILAQGLWRVSRPNYKGLEGWLNLHTSFSGIQSDYRRLMEIPAGTTCALTPRQAEGVAAQVTRYSSIVRMF